MIPRGLAQSERGGEGDRHFEEISGISKCKILGIFQLEHFGHSLQVRIFHGAVAHYF